MIQIQYVFPPFANKLYISCCYIIFDFAKQKRKSRYQSYSPILQEVKSFALKNGPMPTKKIELTTKIQHILVYSL
jgi:hypothetical protein